MTDNVCVIRFVEYVVTFIVGSVNGYPSFINNSNNVISLPPLSIG